MTTVKQLEAVMQANQEAMQAQLNQMMQMMQANQEVKQEVKQANQQAKPKATEWGIVAKWYLYYIQKDYSKVTNFKQFIDAFNKLSELEGVEKDNAISLYDGYMRCKELSDNVRGSESSIAKTNAYTNAIGTVASYIGLGPK